MARKRSRKQAGHQALRPRISSGGVFRPPTLFELQLDFLNSRLALVRRKLIFAVNQGRIDVSAAPASLGQCLELSDSHWCLGSFSVKVAEIAEIRSGGNTDRWLDFRFRYPRHRIEHTFSIVFRANVPKHAIDFVCPDEFVATAAVWIEQLEKEVASCKRLEDQCNRVFECMAEHHFEQHVANLNLLLQSAKMFNRTRLLHQFCHNQLNMNISKHHFRAIATELESRGQLSASSRQNSCPTLEEFTNLLSELEERPAFNFVFYKYSLLKSDWMSAAGLRQFFKSEQKEVRSLEECEKMIEKMENKLEGGNTRYLSLKGFYRLFDEGSEFNVFDERHDRVWQDMSRPMSHYFIASSHNTYLWGNQTTQPSSYEMYRRALLAGCRCVEIDIWENGDTEKLVVYHGYTMTSQIQLQPVLETIRESAFVTSDYPIILSIENNCRKLASHRTIARLMRQVFGDLLYTEPVDAERGYHPSPAEMKRRVFVKGSQGKAVVRDASHPPVVPKASIASIISRPEVESPLPQVESPLPQIEPQSELNRFMQAYRLKRQARRYTAQRKKTIQAWPEMINVKNDILEGDEFDDDEEQSSSSDESDSGQSRMPKPGMRMLQRSLARTDSIVGKQETKTKKVSKVAAELAAIINYFQTRKFKSFEDCFHNFSFYEMFSLGEEKSRKLIKQSKEDYVGLTTRNIVRVYPSGFRLDSSNYDPLAHWCAGAQLVALNYQTRNTAPMFFNEALFALNARSGYVLKPAHLRGESTTISQATLHLTIISGQFWRELTHNDESLEVRVQLFNPQHLKDADVRKLWRTRKVANRFNPVWNASFCETIECPELSFLGFKLLNHATLIGHHMISFMALRKGYRYVPLYDPNDQNLLSMARIYVYVDHDFDCQA